ncbi:MAG: ribonuclease H-like domain-containing protein [Clostridiales Family XIII bacterium]|jgi:uncharacterized protein YprB with RNaseH-like and TPR domain|nr:ribonuclease H-like domain-containing protein [Clostridiales Family XIII bacterium]
MHFVDTHFEEDFYSSEAFNFYFGDARIGVFDIETTGLAPSRSKIVLGGVLTPEADGVRVRQFFSEGAHEETELLDLYTDILDGIDVLFNYNGDRFDIPFVNTRLAAHHRQAAFSECISIDMYRVIRAFSDLRSMLPNLKQKTVENYLGFWNSRKDTISGADSVTLYYEYVASKSPELLNFILLHNCDDLLQLSRVISIFDRLDIHEIMFNIGFPIIAAEYSVLADDIRLSADSLEFSGRYKSLPFDFIVFDEGFRASFDNDAGAFSISIPCLHEKDLIFVDLAAMNADFEILSHDPACASGFLVLKNGRTINHKTVNHLVKLAAKSIMSRFIVQ